MPRFSVIIPCYNSSRWIRSALDSVFAQPGDDFEVIAVDDGSTDRTRSILDDYGPGLNVLSQHNHGTGAARNYAISEAAGDYFAFLDSDDVWFPWTLNIFRELIDKFDEPAILAGTPFEFRREVELERITMPQRTIAHLYANYYEAARDGFWFLLQGALVVSRNVIETCGGYSDRRINSEDTHFFMKFGMFPDFLAIKSPPMFGYRLHGGNTIYNTSLNRVGCLHLIDQEKMAAYPGGLSMQDIRRSILATQARSVSVACIRDFDIRNGWELYLKTLFWHCSLGRVKYLLGFPAYFIATMANELMKQLTKKLTKKR